MLDSYPHVRRLSGDREETGLKMRFDEMNKDQLQESRADHVRRLDSGRGTAVYRDLLRNAIEQIDKHLGANADKRSTRW